MRRFDPEGYLASIKQRRAYHAAEVKSHDQLIVQLESTIATDIEAARLAVEDNLCQIHLISKFTCPCFKTH